MTRAQHLRAIAVAALLVFLTACSPKEQEVGAPVRPAAIEDNVFISPDNAVLPLHQWMPKGQPKAIIIGLHGFNDYGNSFASPSSYFNEQGIGVIAYDQRGFGKSPETGIWAGNRNLISDLRQVVLAVKRRYPSTPVFVLGESMGGAVAIVALSQPDFPPVDGLILVAPAVWGDKTMNDFFRASLWLMAHLMPYQTIQSTGDRFRILASDNIEMLKALGRDPLVIKKTRIDAIYGMMRLMDTAYRRSEGLYTPALIVYGAHDQVIPPQPIRDTLMQLKAPYAFGYYPDGYHLLMRDLKARIVLNDIASWIGNKNLPLPSGADKRWKDYNPARGQHTVSAPPPLGAAVAASSASAR